MESGRTYEQAIGSSIGNGIKISQVYPWLNSLISLIPFFSDDRLIRVGGRIEYAELPYAQRHPAFLPRRSRVTELIIREAHMKQAHRGPTATEVSLFHTFGKGWGYWVIGGTSTVKHYIRNCRHCVIVRRERGKQLMSALPPERVRPYSYAFASVQVDYAGPFDVVRGRRSEKRWLCVFACTSSSAVYLEKAEDLSSCAFLRAFRRFLASTGEVTTRIRSENGTNFVGSSNELKRALAEFDQHVVKEQVMLKKGIDWTFGSPLASHHTGLVERHIRSIRKILLGLPEVASRTPSDDELDTLFKEAQLMMNNRPLSRGVHPDGLPPITPAALITGKLDPNVLPESTSPGDVYRKGYRFVKKIAEIWWARWLEEYVQNLQHRPKWTEEAPNLKPGDCVILRDEPTEKNVYPVGMVSEVKTDQDGRVRTVFVAMKDGTTKMRDIRRTALIEAAAGDDDSK